MNINICGRRQEGKTTLALYLARKRHSAIVVFDPRGMIGGTKCWSPEDLEEAIEEGVWRDGQPLVYRFDGDDTGAEFDQVCDILFPPRFPRGGFALIVDEAQMLQNAHKIRPSLDRAMKQHPTFPARESVTIIQTTHRMVNLHGDNKAIMDEFYLFHTTLRNDVETIRDFCGDYVAEIVPTLPIHHCVRYEYGRKASGEQYEVWSDPSIWFSPLSGDNTLSLESKDYDEDAPNNCEQEGIEDAKTNSTSHATDSGSRRMEPRKAVGR